MMLTKREAADRLRVHPDTIGRYIRRGWLDASKTAAGGGGRVLIAEEAIDTFLEQRRVRAAAR